MKWEVDLHDDFVREYRDLHKDVQDELLARIELLEQFGPQLATRGDSMLFLKVGPFATGNLVRMSQKVHPLGTG